MESEEIVKFFDYMSDVDDPYRDQDFEDFIRNAGAVGINVLIENLRLNRYLKDSIWLCQKLELKQAIPLVKPHLESADEAVSIAAAIALTKLGDEDGLTRLTKMFHSGKIPESWLSLYGISHLVK
ncbi:HEAT repeat domain-containing protein [Coleofasciculus sp. FACHB-SPT9]|uniref:HEAT repeat domain-containing protein n=1 Tax=Cyanophyceae TaxID=3028117 RepID=UPI001685F2F2|nr:HEAT repeat domain-containing protein [Coleofasciculus sp. FACHB-SPT9]MBD1892961.1 HEAT repeat domain-containing protein [Coleofasciculus sp. FACHB-SPT9]